MHLLEFRNGPFDGLEIVPPHPTPKRLFEFVIASPEGPSWVSRYKWSDNDEAYKYVGRFAEFLTDGWWHAVVWRWVSAKGMPDGGWLWQFRVMELEEETY